jgi:hypothetical protein
MFVVLWVFVFIICGYPREHSVLTMSCPVLHSYIQLETHENTSFNKWGYYVAATTCLSGYE